MTDDKPQSALDEQIIADLRRTHAQLKRNTDAALRTGDRTAAAWSMRLTLEEVDALLRLHDEVIELRKQTVGDWEPDFPPVRAAVVGYVADRLIPDGLVPTQDTGTATDRYYDGSRVRTDGLSAILDGEGCPRRDTVHDCPLGGCATGREARETPPDLPETAAEVATRVSDRLAPKRRARPCPGLSSHMSVTGSLRCEKAAGHEGVCTRDGWSWTTSNPTGPAA